MQRPWLLSVAGFDPTGGAGVVADSTAARSQGVPAAAIVTGVVAQDADRVYRVDCLPRDSLSAQFDAVSSLPLGAVKSGFLCSDAAVDNLLELLDSTRLPYVLDPLIRARDGTPLNEPLWDRIRGELAPRATVVTFNAVEAEWALGVGEARGLRDLLWAAARLRSQLGSQAVVVKGGHAPGDTSVDVMVYDEGVVVYANRRLPARVHGLGCTYSAALAAKLAAGSTLLEAFEAAGGAAYAAALYSRSTDSSFRIAEAAALSLRAQSILEAYHDLRDALQLLRELRGFEKLIPEVGSNIAVAGRAVEPATPADTVAVDGRIRRSTLWGLTIGPPAPGASDHMARLVSSLANLGSKARACINIKPLPEVIKAAEELGIQVLVVRRSEEPEPGREGATMRWIAAIARRAQVPFLVYDTGAHGKEPMARLCASTAKGLVELLASIIRAARLQQ